MIWRSLSTLLLCLGETFRFSEIIIFSPSSTPFKYSIQEIPEYLKSNQLSFVRTTSFVNQTLAVHKIPNLICTEISGDSCSELELQLNLFFEFVTNHTQLSRHCFCVIFPEDSSTEVATDKEAMTHLLRRVFSIKFSINSCLYFVANKWIFEGYKAFGEIVFRELTQDGKSTLWTRRNYHRGMIVTGHVKSWEIISKTGEETLNKSQTGSYQIFAYMQDLLNFSTSIRPQKNWQAMAENIQSGQVDFGLSATGMLKSVAKDFRFTTIPTYTEQVMAYYAYPKEVTSVALKNFLHTRPFRWDAWIVTFVCFVLLCFCHFFISTQKIGKSFWWIVSCTTLQGPGTRGQNSLRILMFTASVLCIILYATYSGSLISSLSTQKEKEFTLQELFERGFTFGVTNDSFLRAAKEAGDYIKNSLAGKIFTSLHPTKGQVVGMGPGINFVFENQKYAFLTEENVYEKMTYSEKNTVEMVCTLLREIPIPEYTVQQSPIVRRDSPYMNHFNFARLRMKEFGIWDLHFKRRNTGKKLQRPVCHRTTEFKSFTVLDVLLPIFIMIIGHVLSLLSLSVEFMIMTKKRMQNKIFKDTLFHLSQSSK